MSEPLKLDRMAADLVAAFLRAHGEPNATIEPREGGFVVRAAPGRYVVIEGAERADDAPE